MINIIDKARLNVAENRPFVLYAKPGSDELIGIFQKTAFNYSVENFQEEGFVFSSFSAEEQLLIPISEADILIEKILDEGDLDFGQPTITTDGKSEFEALVRKAIEQIQIGTFEKVVLSRKEVLDVEVDVLKVFSKLLKLYPSAFRYVFFHPKSGFWTGATPEQLLKIEQNQLKTVALAGTQVHHEGEIIWAEKEQKEQEFVTDFIAKNLEDFVFDLSFSKPYSAKAGNLVHIKTDISARLKNENSLGEIVRVLHPTPAVCGSPKELAMKFIEQNENYDREFYSGFLGELNWSATNSTTTDLYVNLRCMKIEQGKPAVFVGCGITKDSDPEKEFFETANKALTIKKALI